MQLERTFVEAGGTLIDGNPVADIEDLRSIELVSKNGIGFSRVALIESVRGKVGLH